ncbi:hypothetical protein ACMFMG_000445 [Clarireedia jacksonii]
MNAGDACFAASVAYRKVSSSPATSPTPLTLVWRGQCIYFVLQALYKGPTGWSDIGSLVNDLLSLREAYAFVARRRFRGRRSRLKRMKKGGDGWAGRGSGESWLVWLVCLWWMNCDVQRANGEYRDDSRRPNLAIYIHI